ncbi:MAG: AAA family ATPase [Ignavibacteria bacterium]|nr:AAA family ATPase [Ignavibacteria bacterium]
MKISSVKINKFKRFTDLTIKDIPESARLIILVGPNGCGKTSMFEAFNHWYRWKGFNNHGQKEYYEKIDTVGSTNTWYQEKVTINIHNSDALDKEEIKGKFYFRTAYRNEPDFTVSNLNKQGDPTQGIKLQTLMQNDIRQNVLIVL